MPEGRGGWRPAWKRNNFFFFQQQQLFWGQQCKLCILKLGWMLFKTLSLFCPTKLEIKYHSLQYKHSKCSVLTVMLTWNIRTSFFGCQANAKTVFFICISLKLLNLDKVILVWFWFSILYLNNFNPFENNVMFCLITT